METKNTKCAQPFPLQTLFSTRPRALGHSGSRPSERMRHHMYLRGPTRLAALAAYAGWLDELTPHRHARHPSPSRRHLGCAGRPIPRGGPLGTLVFWRLFHPWARGCPRRQPILAKSSLQPKPYSLVKEISKYTTEIHNTHNHTHSSVCSHSAATSRTQRPRLKVGLGLGAAAAAAEHSVLKRLPRHGLVTDTARAEWSVDGWRHGSRWQL